MATGFNARSPAFNAVGSGGAGVRYAGAGGEGGRLPGMPIPGDESAFPFGWGGGVPGGGVPQPTYYGPPQYPLGYNMYDPMLYPLGYNAGYSTAAPQGQGALQQGAQQGGGFDVTSLIDLARMVRKAPEYLDRLSSFLNPNAGQGLQLPAMQGAPGIGTGLSMVPSTGFQAALAGQGAPYGSGSLVSTPAGAPQGTSMGLDISQGNSLANSSAETMFPDAFPGAAAASAAPAAGVNWAMGGAGAGQGMGPAFGTSASSGAGALGAAAIPALMLAWGMGSRASTERKQMEAAQRYRDFVATSPEYTTLNDDEDRFLSHSPLGRSYYEYPFAAAPPSNLGTNEGYGPNSLSQVLQTAVRRPAGTEGRAQSTGQYLGDVVAMEYPGVKDVGALENYLKDTTIPLQDYAASVPNFARNDAGVEAQQKWLASNPAPYVETGMRTVERTKSGNTRTIRDTDPTPAGWSLVDDTPGVFQMNQYRNPKTGETVTFGEGQRVPSNYEKVMPSGFNMPEKPSRMARSGNGVTPTTQMRSQTAATAGTVQNSPSRPTAPIQNTSSYGAGVSAAQRTGIMSMEEYRSALDDKTKGAWSKSQTPLQQWESYNQYKTNNLR